MGLGLGGLGAEASDAYDSAWSVAFVGNSAVDFGGAIFIEQVDLLEVSEAIFEANEAQLGGAVYIASVEDKQTNFSSCVFEGNKAADGGAVYLYTGPAVDLFTASVFRNNFAGEMLRNVRTCEIERPHHIVAVWHNVIDRDRQEASCGGGFSVAVLQLQI